MKQFFGGKKKDATKSDSPITQKKPSKILFAGLVVLYVLVAIQVSRVSASQETIEFFGSVLPVAAFPGVFSALSNLVLIIIVMFYGRAGFLFSLCALLVQFPLVIQGFVMRHNPTSIPGLFTTALTVVTIIVIYSRNQTIENYRKKEVEHWKNQQKEIRRLFEQTATALVNAIDAKDAYSHGHSLRVAEYSEMLARELNKSEDDSRRIYYAALLHDTGKIGIPGSIINKNGRLTKEEYEIIKEHPVKGAQILSGIREYPYLSTGAHYHHERYDGNGYPDGLKGEEIPEIARIISVADSYDAMSSNRSYRKALPQQLVREEVIKGMGTQFDPDVAKAMVRLIDLDTEYDMREKEAVEALAGKNELLCTEYRAEISDGIHVTEQKVKIRLKSKPMKAWEDSSRGVALVLFDSLDARYHEEEIAVKELCYYEYGEIWLSGKASGDGARKMKVNAASFAKKDDAVDEGGASSYEIEAARYKDHVLIRIDDGYGIKEITYALFDSSRFFYIGITGEGCRIYDVDIQREENPIEKDSIIRIAEEVSYIKGKKTGDIPNLQVDGYRTEETEGIPLNTSLVISYHTMSLPTARLVWHCPYFVIFTSYNGKIGGPGYREYALIRPDGENWKSDGCSDIEISLQVSDDFAGWDDWKEKNKEGFDSKISFAREGQVITATTENLGVALTYKTTVLDGCKEFYVALTGDQVALTNIRISEE